jgi:CRISPR-associated protein Cas2
VEYLVVYDVNTETHAGEKRLRRVAKVCEGYGFRVQKSVFECNLDGAQVGLLLRDLAEEIDARVDRVGIYRLHGAGRAKVLRLGPGPDFDHARPYIL